MVQILIKGNLESKQRRRLKTDFAIIGVYVKLICFLTNITIKEYWHVQLIHTGLIRWLHS